MPKAPRTHRPSQSRPENKADDLRLGASYRGYDSGWRRLRQWYVLMNPLCEDCLARDVVTPVQEVDHIKAFKGKRDPLRLDHTNLRSLCRSCHRKKHARW